MRLYSFLRLLDVIVEGVSPTLIHMRVVEMPLSVEYLNPRHLPWIPKIATPAYGGLAKIFEGSASTHYGALRAYHTLSDDSW